MKQKICVISGSRAEYGLYRPLLQKIKTDKKYILQIIATGNHFSPLYGNTYKEIIKDGFSIDAKVPLKSKENDAAEITGITGDAVKGLGKALKKLQPDLVVLLGDRFEMLAAAVAAHLLLIPAAHIHGGEITEGSLDDAMRHAITKLSALHFTSTEVYRKRVIQMGEEPSRVFNVGSLGVENALTLKLLTKQQLESALKISIKKPVAVITFHPATNEKISSALQLKSLLSALDRFPGMQCIITYPNADSGGMAIIKAIEKYAANQQNVHIYKSLGALNYLSLLNYADIVIGNSSSGIIEVPSFGIPTINIGDRQKSRMAASSVIHTKPIEGDIYKSIAKALKPAFRQRCRMCVNPYDKGSASKNMLSALNKIKNFRTIDKKFYDLK